jgi:tetratricopeptide (TPR) repeat protein
VKRYIPYLVIGAGYLALRIHALGAFAPQKRHVTLSAYQYAINVFPLFIQYLNKLLVPINLNAFYVFHPIASLYEVKGALSLMATLVFVVLFPIALKKNRAAFLGLVLMTVPLLPVLYIPALGENPFTDRYLYLPSVGYVLLLAIFFSWVKVKLPRAARNITIVFLITIGLYTVGTIKRNNVWKDNSNLWSDAVRKAPDSAVAHNNLGVEYESKGLPDMAITEYQAALRLNPDFADAHNNLANAYASKGLLDMAIAEYQTALRLNPDYAKAHYNLGVAYASKGLSDMAIAEYETALRLNPDYAKAHYNLGVEYESEGLLDMAITEYQTALRLNPDYSKAHNNLGVAYASKGLPDMAITEYQAALRLNPDYVEARYNLASTYLRQGKADSARREVEAVLKIRPDFNEARKLLYDINSRRN